MEKKPQLLGHYVYCEDINEEVVENKKDIKLYANAYQYDKLPTQLRVPNRKTDMGITLDMFTIVSERFKSLCLQHHFENIEFVKLPSDPGFYLMRVNNIAHFDAERSAVKFSLFDNNTGEYQGIHGPYPPYIINNAKIPEGSIYRSDLFFGEYVKKTPVYMVGIETKQQLMGWKIKGLGCKDILDKYRAYKKPIN